MFRLGVDSVLSARHVLSSHLLSEAFLSWEHVLPEPRGVTMEPRLLNIPGEPLETTDSSLASRQPSQALCFDKIPESLMCG